MKDKVTRIICVLLPCIVMVVALAMLILAGLWGKLIIAVIAAACAFGQYKAKKNSLIVSVIATLGLGYTLCFAEGFSGGLLWQHKFQLMYVRAFSGSYDFIPDSFDYEVEEFSVEFMPSMMQGSGHYFVSVKVDEETAARLIKEAEEKSFRKFGATEDYNLDVDDRYKTSYYYMPDEIRNSEKYTVYACFTNENFNHPRSKSMIINDEENIVCWSQV